MVVILSQIPTNTDIFKNDIFHERSSIYCNMPMETKGEIWQQLASHDTGVTFSQQWVQCVWTCNVQASPRHHYQLLWSADRFSRSCDNNKRAQVGFLLPKAGRSVARPMWLVLAPRPGVRCTFWTEHWKYCFRSVEVPIDLWIGSWAHQIL